MKNILFPVNLFYTFLFILIGRSNAQAPQAISYQAVARDNTSNIISNQNISLRFSIHDATATGTVVYSETQSTTTNSLGLFSVNIGQGTVVTGTFSSIDWGGGSKFIQVEMDPAGGISYTDMGTQQMLSVPYALNAGNGNWAKTGNDISNSNSGKVGIGTSTPAAKLDIAGNLKITDGTQASGMILTSDANGLASWQPGADPALEGLLCNLYFSLGLPEPGLCSYITNVTVTTDMGECCGGTLGAMLNGSGLTSYSYLGLHDANDGSGWKSNFILTGFLLFDLQAVYNLQRFAVWNHGQLGGDRGVNELTIETSVNGVTYTPLPDGPSQLEKATAVPVEAQKFVLASPVTARYVRFNITSGYGAVTTGLGEVMFWAN